MRGTEQKLFEVYLMSSILVLTELIVILSSFPARCSLFSSLGRVEKMLSAWINSQ